MGEVQLIITPDLSISEARRISTVMRNRIYPYLLYAHLNTYEISFRVYDNGVLDTLESMMMKGEPVFFDFSRKIDDLWGHMYIRSINPTFNGFRTYIEVNGYLVPSWGSVLGRTRNSGILMSSGDYTYLLGSTRWNNRPTIDSGSGTIQWEFTAWNPLMDVDYEMNLTNAVEYTGGTGSYQWSRTILNDMNLGDYPISVVRSSGDKQYYWLKNSSDGSDQLFIDTTNVPFIHTSLKVKGTMQIRIYDSDEQDYRYTSFTDVYSLSTYTQNFHKTFTWSYDDAGTGSTDIDYSTSYPILVFDSAERAWVDRVGFTYGRPAIYEFRVPSYDSDSTVKIETYSTSDSTWYTLIEFDPRHPEDYSLTSEWNLYYNNGAAAPHVDNVMTFALYRLGTNGETVSPVTYEDKTVNLFPDMEYSNIVGYSFGLGVLLGPDDDNHNWSRVRFRITYPYDDIALGDDYLGVST